jgi:hypothetical protein
VISGAFYDHSLCGRAVPDDADRPDLTFPRWLVVPVGADEVAAGKFEDAGPVAEEHSADDGLDGAADDETACNLSVAGVEWRPALPVAGIHRPQPHLTWTAPEHLEVQSVPLVRPAVGLLRQAQDVDEALTAFRQVHEEPGYAPRPRCRPNLSDHFGAGRELALQTLEITRITLSHKNVLHPPCLTIRGRPRNRVTRSAPSAHAAKSVSGPDAFAGAPPAGTAADGERLSPGVQPRR